MTAFGEWVARRIKETGTDKGSSTTGCCACQKPGLHSNLAADAQQHALLCNRQTNPCPRQQFLTHVEKAIKELQCKGHAVVSLSDGNESMKNQPRNQTKQ